jgi:hypothetical protein
MHVCIHVCMYVYLCMDIIIYIRVHVCMCVYACMYDIGIYVLYLDNLSVFRLQDDGDK